MSLNNLIPFWQILLFPVVICRPPLFKISDSRDLFVGGFKNSCRLTDVNLNYLRPINQDSPIPNSNPLFTPKFLTQEMRGSELTNPDLIGT